MSTPKVLFDELIDGAHVTAWFDYAHDHSGQGGGSIPIITLEARIDTQCVSQSFARDAIAHWGDMVEGTDPLADFCGFHGSRLAHAVKRQMDLRSNAQPE